MRKTLVSGFVLASYIAYAVHQHTTPLAQGAAPAPTSPQQGQSAQPPDQAGQLPGQGQASQDQTAPGAQAPGAAAPTAPPQAANGSPYRNGTFTGASANAFYGEVQVQVVISKRRISSITLLNYPSDRRTSARINSFAIPYLQSEAIQAQSANVDIISGATLTSEAFMLSLQSALDGARG